VLRTRISNLCAGENQLTIMLESCRSLMFTDWAFKDSGVLGAEDVPLSAWDLAPVGVVSLLGS
jgi:hypothetical protein